MTRKRATFKAALGDRNAVTGRIVEVTFPDGRGCLVSLHGPTEAGEWVIEVFRADTGITVVGPKGA
jgi:hypothetical protein